MKLTLAIEQTFAHDPMKMGIPLQKVFWSALFSLQYVEAEMENLFEVWKENVLLLARVVFYADESATRDQTGGHWAERARRLRLIARDGYSGGFNPLFEFFSARKLMMIDSTIERRQEVYEEALRILVDTQSKWMRPCYEITQGCLATLGFECLETLDQDAIVRSLGIQLSDLFEGDPYAYEKLREPGHWRRMDILVLVRLDMRAFDCIQVTSIRNYWKCSCASIKALDPYDNRLLWKAHLAGRSPRQMSDQEMISAVFATLTTSIESMLTPDAGE